MVSTTPFRLVAIVVSLQVDAHPQPLTGKDDLATLPIWGARVGGQAEMALSGAMCQLPMIC